MKIKITEPAAQDIEKIFEDGFHAHGEKAATQYVEGMFRRLDMLSEFPYLGHPRDDIPLTHRALKAEKEHIAVYRIEGDIIHVVRILRGNSDFAQQEIH